MWRLIIVVVVVLAIVISNPAQACSVCEEGYHDYFGVVIEPEHPPEEPGMLEELVRIYPDTVVVEETKIVIAVCVIELRPRLAELGEPIPLDHLGERQILLDDGMTFLSLSELIQLVDEELCQLRDLIPVFELV
jgi:hypothetical protein